MDKWSLLCGARIFAIRDHGRKSEEKTHGVGSVERVSMLRRHGPRSRVRGNPAKGRLG